METTAATTPTAPAAAQPAAPAKWPPYPYANMRCCRCRPFAPPRKGSLRALRAELWGKWAADPEKKVPGAPTRARIYAGTAEPHEYAECHNCPNKCRGAAGAAAEGAAEAAAPAGGQRRRRAPLELLPMAPTPEPAPPAPPATETPAAPGGEPRRLPVRVAVVDDPEQEPFWGDLAGAATPDAPHARVFCVRAGRALADLDTLTPAPPPVDLAEAARQIIDAGPCARGILGNMGS